MKTNLIKHFTIILFFLSLIPYVTSAQEQSEITRNFEFAKSSKTEKVDFEVAEGIDHLWMQFEGKLTEGSMKIKFTDPDGNVVSGFSLVCSRAEGNNNVNHNTNTNSDSGNSVTTSVSSSGSTGVSVSSSSSSATGSTVSSSSTISGKRKSSKSKKNKNSGYSTYQTTESDETGARGVMNKEIENPQPGKWKYSIITDGASGQLSAKIRLN